MRLTLFTGSEIDTHPPLVMEESKKTSTKRPLESSLPWIRNREGAGAEAEANYINPIRKRPCSGGDGDSFEEFFTLLQRIKATERHCFRTRNQLNRQEPAVKCVKTFESKASWRPSFEWEDFSSRGNGTCDVKSSLSSVKASDGWVKEKEVGRHASKNLKPEASRNPDLEGLDLNSLPAGLPLFE